MAFKTVELILLAFWHNINSRVTTKTHQKKKKRERKKERKNKGETRNHLKEGRLFDKCWELQFCVGNSQFCSWEEKAGENSCFSTLS